MGRQDTVATLLHAAAADSHETNQVVKLCQQQAGRAGDDLGSEEGDVVSRDQHNKSSGRTIKVGRASHYRLRNIPGNDVRNSSILPKRVQSTMKCDPE